MHFVGAPANRLERPLEVKARRWGDRRTFTFDNNDTRFRHRVDDHRAGFTAAALDSARYPGARRPSAAKIGRERDTPVWSGPSALVRSGDRVLESVHDRHRWRRGAAAAAGAKARRRPVENIPGSRTASVEGPMVGASA